MSTDRAVRPTTADVARLADVSTATVSYVLNNVEGRRISAQTRDAVNRAAKLLGYRPNLAARNLAETLFGVVQQFEGRNRLGVKSGFAGFHARQGQEVLGEA